MRLYRDHSNAYNTGLPGQQVVLVANLEPRKMRGVESQGMVLMAEDASGRLVFVQPREAVPPGGEVR